MAPTAALVLLTLLAGTTAPKSGEDLVRQMHARYAGKWYRTVTFVQTTTFPGKPAETWYEAGTIPGKLRIDVAPLDSMTAFMFVGDSSVVFKGGQRVAAQEDRNLLMTLGFDVYGQAPEVDHRAAQGAARRSEPDPRGHLAGHQGVGRRRRRRVTRPPTSSGSRRTGCFSCGSSSRTRASRTRTRRPSCST